MPPRTVALIGAVCLTTGWLLASVLTPPVARVQALPERAATPAPAAISLPPVERLQFRLSEAPPPPTPRRNPFEFGGRERVSTVPDVDAAPARPVMDAVAAPAIVGRQYSLAGIGTTTGPEGPVHTAVVSDGTAVHLVKQGDAVGGYTAVEVTAATITLADAAGVRHVLRLKH